MTPNYKAATLVTMMLCLGLLAMQPASAGGGYVSPSEACQNAMDALHNDLDKLGSVSLPNPELSQDAYQVKANCGTLQGICPDGALNCVNADPQCNPTGTLCAGVDGWTQNFGSDQRCGPITQANEFCFEMHGHITSWGVLDIFPTTTVSSGTANTCGSFECSTDGFFLGIGNTPCNQVSGTVTALGGTWAAPPSVSWCNS